MTKPLHFIDRPISPKQLGSLTYAEVLTVVVGFFILFAVLLVVLLLSSGWRFWRIQKSPAVASFPLDLKWQIDLGHSTYDRPVYDNGAVFFPANRGFTSYWYKLETTTGQVIWSHQATPDSFMRCLTPDYMVMSGMSSLLALDPDTGKIIWEGDVGHSASCSDKAVFVISYRSFPYAANLSTGETLWGGTNPRESFSGLIYNPEANELIGGGAVIIDPNSGNILRYFEPSFIGLAPFLIDHGQLFVGNNVRDAKTGQILHLEENLGGYGSPIITEDTIYIADSTDEIDPKGVTALDRDNFEIKWQYAPKDEPSGDLLVTMSPVAIFDGVGYVIFADATLRAFDLKTGREIGYWQPKGRNLFNWSFWTLAPFLGSAPSGYGMAASEDTLFASFGDGTLYAFGRK